MIVEKVAATPCVTLDAELSRSMQILKALTDELRDAETWAAENMEIWDRTEKEWDLTRKELKARIEKAEADFAASESEKEASAEKVAAIEKGVGEAKARTDELELETEEAERAICLLEHDVEAAETRESKVQKSSGDLEEKLASTRDAIAALERLDAEHKDDLAIKEERNRDAIAEFTDKLAALDEELVEISAEKSDILHRLEKHREPVLDPTQELRDQLVAAQSALPPLVEKAREGQAKYDAARARRAAATERLAQLQVEAVPSKEQTAVDCLRHEEKQLHDFQLRLESTRREIKGVKASFKSIGTTMVTEQAVSDAQAEVAERCEHNQILREEITRALVVLSVLKQQTKSEKTGACKTRVAQVGAQLETFESCPFERVVEENLVTAKHFSGVSVELAQEREHVECEGECETHVREEEEEEEEDQQVGQHGEEQDDEKKHVANIDNVQVVEQEEEVQEVQELQKEEEEEAEQEEEEEEMEEEEQHDHDVDVEADATDNEQADEELVGETKTKMVREEKQGATPPKPRRVARQKKFVPPAKGRKPNEQIVGNISKWTSDAWVDRTFGIVGILLVVQVFVLTSLLGDF